MVLDTIHTWPTLTLAAPRSRDSGARAMAARVVDELATTRNRRGHRCMISPSPFADATCVWQLLTATLDRRLATRVLEIQAMAPHRTGDLPTVRDHPWTADVPRLVHCFLAPSASHLADPGSLDLRRCHHGERSSTDIAFKRRLGSPVLQCLRLSLNAATASEVGSCVLDRVSSDRRRRLSAGTRECRIARFAANHPRLARHRGSKPPTAAEPTFRASCWNRTSRELAVRQSTTPRIPITSGNPIDGDDIFAERVRRAPVLHRGGDESGDLG